MKDDNGPSFIPPPFPGPPVMHLPPAERRVFLALALSFRLPGPCRDTDFGAGEALGRNEGGFEVKVVERHSARLLVCGPVSP